MRITRKAIVALAATLLSSAAAITAGPAAAAGVPRPDHVVVVVMENHSYSEIIGSSSAPYINNTLKAGGANFTQSFAVSHPSEPNYLALRNIGSRPPSPATASARCRGWGSSEPGRFVTRTLAPSPARPSEIVAARGDRLRTAT